MGKVTSLKPEEDDHPRPSNGRRSSGARTYSSSPEFEFWMVRNPSCPPPVLLSADELFVDGVLLPLHLVSNRQPEEAALPCSDAPPAPISVAKLAAIERDEAKSTPSKRWRDLFKKKEGNDKVEKKERKGGGSSISGTSSAELNINIWPFSRSRSAGNSGTRRRQAVSAPRKVSSAPCSRSNSAGESKSRKWPSSPGVHVGRSSPVWQVKRGVTVSSYGEKAARKEGERAKISSRTSMVPESGDKAAPKMMNMNVPTCIGYKQNLNCRVVENGRRGYQIDGGIGSGGARSVVNIFNLRSFFHSSKKVY